MKKHLSIPGLFARSTLLPILCLLAVLTAVESFFFCTEVQERLAAYFASIGSVPELERIFDSAATYAYFRVALLGSAAILCLPGCQFRVQSSYTWRRLSLSERSIFLWQFAYNILMLTFVLLWQLAVAYGLCHYWRSAAPSGLLDSQTLFFAFYRNEFLHALLPLSDIALWARNILLVLALGLAAAIFPFKQRRGKVSGSIIAVGTYATVAFDRGISDAGHTALAAVILLMVLAEIISAFIFASDDETEEQTEEVSDHA